MTKRAEALGRLADAAWLRRPETQQMLEILDGRAGRTRAVGGIVRDTLLGHGRQDTDVDLATELLPQEVMRRGFAAGMGVHPTGFDHGTVTLHHGRLVAEVTTLRQDVETDGRRAVVRFGTDWARDAERRDFTLNALYAGMDGALFDPLGGIEDCLAGRIRFIGEPDRRIAEDRLRVYRFFRFSASHGSQRFDGEGLDACRRAAGTLGRLSAERIGGEMRRMLALPEVSLTIGTMVAAGVLGLSPESMRLMADYEQRARPPTLAGRLAVFVAEVGAEAIQQRWRLANADVAAAVGVLEAERLVREGRLNEAAYRHRPVLGDAIVLAAIRAGWSDADVAGLEERVMDLSIPRFPLTGRDLLAAGHRPGRDLGIELNRLEQLWIESGFALDRPALLAAMRTP